jgi:predicted negative regulator of RcsB-dependent stress response
MNQSKPVATVGETAASIEQRLRAHPELLPDVVALLDIVELKRADTATADQAERGVRATLQQLGQKTLGAWAAQRQGQVVAQTQATDAAVQRHAQKNSRGTPPTAPSR